MKLPVVNHQDYVAKINDDNKFPIRKFGELANYLINQKVVDKFYKPEFCSENTLSRAHSLDYINSVKKKTLDTKSQKKIGPETEKRATNEIKENISSNKIIDQIKNISQEEKNKPQVQTEIKAENKILINSFDDLLLICSEKKEIKLKYELEKNVNLVKFEKNRIEISFNDSLDKDFVKDLSSKLFDWTAERWIITFSKSKGEMSVKEKQLNNKKLLIDEAKSSEAYKNIIENFPDAELIDVKIKKDQGQND